MRNQSKQSEVRRLTIRVSNKLHAHIVEVSKQTELEVQRVCQIALSRITPQEAIQGEQAALKQRLDRLTASESADAPAQPSPSDTAR